ncbi:MAG: DUF4365 domain-containing protein [Archangium sp.]|nr:DUF4365 domain-containing protein [Archangium sp.]
MLAEKVLENRSRTIFNEAVLPWLVTDWTEHDYGIDAIIEITRAREVGENFDATGKRFAIQLKATEEEIAGRNAAPVRVKPEQIRYWIESTEPVLLVLCHVPTRQLFWRWIDYPVVDELNRRDPAWIGQETVTVHLPTTRTFDAAARKEIATFVTTFRRSARRVLAPGAYLALHTRLLALASTLTAHARDAGFQSVLKRLADLEASIRTSTYVVVLTGPARAGKSTLLNALVGREVSPVGRLPTTAVSLMVMAGPRDEAEVVLAGDERVRGDATAAFLEEYATQEKNPDNHKGVRMVAVRLVNELLERGVAYADAPGLHDPSEEIRAVTEAALKAAHAVMYVLDVSPAKDGGFYLSNHHLADLKRLAAMAERLFVVLNKADALDADERSFVAHYVEQTLRKYSAWDSLPVPPLFLSASAGWKWQTSGRLGESPLAALDDAIWTHLLRTNSTGLDRLGNAVVELRRAGSDFASLLQTRRMSGTEAFRLRGALDECRRTQRELIARCRQRTENDERFVSDRLTEQTAALLQRLKARLEAVPLDGTLPNAAQLEQELQAQVTNILGQVWLETSARFQVFASSVSQEVERSLQQARLATGASEQVSFLLPQVPALNIAADSFEEAWTGLFTGGLFGLLIGGPWGWALLAGGWLAGLFLGREPKRKREIARIVDRVLSSLTAALEVVLKQVHEKIRIYLGSLERHVNDRISVFVHDVEGQLKKLDIPIGPDEARRLEVHEQAVRATLNSLHNACTQLELQGRTEQAAPMAAPSEKTF